MKMNSQQTPVAAAATAAACPLLLL